MLSLPLALRRCGFALLTTTAALLVTRLLGLGREGLAYFRTKPIDLDELRSPLEVAPLPREA
jgi:hypothetical protein